MTLDRSIKLLIGTVVAAVVLLARIFHIQVVDDRYKTDAINNSVVRETVYPPRGVIYDRDSLVLVGNGSTYDIMVLPREVPAFDTLALAEILGTDTSYVRERMAYYRKFRTRIGFKPQTFLRQVDAASYMRFAEVQYRFPGFYGQYRTMRVYPYNAGGSLLGYVSEVDPSQISRDPEYRPGDMAGKTGLESAREKDLRGSKGYKLYLRDSRNRLLSSWRAGVEDKPAVPGHNITTTISAPLQQYGQELMKSKVGSLIAIEPRTGEILALISSPCIDVDVLANINQEYPKLLADPYKPMFNRAVQGSYPPGSVFKLVNGLVGLQEGVLKPGYEYPCHDGYQYTRTQKLGCHHHRSPLDLREAVMHSCNSYFCYVWKNILENGRYQSEEEAFRAWEEYVRSFGFGSPLGSDFPAELGGTIPTAEKYDRIYGRGHWNYASVISLSIGQGEIGVTPLQIANLSAIMANRGWYRIPHIVKESAGLPIDPKYYEKRYTKVDTSFFEVIVDGMYDAVNAGPGSGATATLASIPGLDVCGKTGTAQNPHGDDNSVFICFAPRDNPRIAVAAYVENAGFGATWACPIASLMVEKYLCGGVSGQRRWIEDYVMSADLIHKEERL